MIYLMNLRTFPLLSFFEQNMVKILLSDEQLHFFEKYCFKYLLQAFIQYILKFYMIQYTSPSADKVRLRRKYTDFNEFRGILNGSALFSQHQFLLMLSKKCVRRNTSQHIIKCVAEQK